MIRRRLAYLVNALKTVTAAARDVEGIHQALLRNELDRLKEQPQFADPKHLIPYGTKVYSQCDEDGIIREIFKRIGTTNKSFVEFGIGDGLENNTLALLFDNWQGLWIDASTKSINNIQSAFSRLIEARKLTVVETFITRDNINRLIEENVEHKQVDLLSVDVDGNDYHILCAITSISPRVIVIEYNAKFPPPLLYCMEYNQAHFWTGGDCFGASLKFLEVNLRDRGYCLVGCNLAGSNAFFVRNDLVADKFFEPFNAENHYQPARYYLIGISSGHPASYDTLAKNSRHRQSIANEAHE